jgi:hypothetical protein
VLLDDFRRGNPFDPSGLLAKTSVLRKVRFDESLRLGEDWDAFIRIAERYTIGYVREPLVIYNDGNHRRMTNETRSLSRLELAEKSKFLQKHRDFLGERRFNFYYAAIMLSNYSDRDSKLGVMTSAVRSCGLLPVLTVLVNKIYHTVKEIVSRLPLSNYLK